jgi:hypothetical protein
LILLNYFRVRVVGDVGMGYACDPAPHHSSDNSTSEYDSHRALSSGDDVSFHVNHSCADYLLPYALICSGLLVIFGCFVAFLTIRSKNKLLALAGVHSEDDVLHSLRKLLLKEQYTLRTQHSREIPTPLSTTAVGSHPPSSSTSLPLSPTPTERPSRRKVPRNRSLFSFNSIPQEEYSLCALRIVLHIHLEEQDTKAHQWLHTIHHLGRTLADFCFQFFPRRSNQQHRLSPVIERVHSLRMKAQHDQESRQSVTNGRDGDNDEDDVEMQMTGGGGEEGVTAIGSADEGDQDNSFDAKNHPLAHELHSVFPFSSRELHEFLIQEMLLLDSLFLALWATNFITLSLHSTDQITFNLLFLIPIFLMTILNFLIMFLTSTLFAVTSLKNKGAEWICEQNDICEKVLPNLRREILNILPDGATDKRLVELYQLIAAMRCCPTDGLLRVEEGGGGEDGTEKRQQQPGGGGADGGISLEGFAELLRILDMHPSEKEIRALFRSMDKDDRSLSLSRPLGLTPLLCSSGSGSIELSELKALLLDPNVAKAKPNKHKKCFIDI